MDNYLETMKYKMKKMSWFFKPAYCWFAILPIWLSMKKVQEYE